VPRLLLNGLPDDPVRDVTAAIAGGGGQAEVYQGDVSEPAEAHACVDFALQRFVGLDVMVNNAGIFIAFAETDDYRIEDFGHTVQHNLRTAFLMTKFALPHLQKTRGNNICAGSEAGINVSAGFTSYGGSKAFLHAFVMGVALEQAKYGVRANCVCPGAIDTAWTRPGLGPLDEAMADFIDIVVPLGRLGSPEEMADIYAFLAAD
jgi:NAD(P)-dependent dehydrogenase (short-subunit alcohol dehydrogenase family)